MDVNMHCPKRTQCETMKAEESGPFAIMGFKDNDGATLNLFFTNPDEMREHAEALRLLADSLEERQS